MSLLHKGFNRHFVIRGRGHSRLYDYAIAEKK